MSFDIFAPGFGIGASVDDTKEGSLSNAIYGTMKSPGLALGALAGSGALSSDPSNSGNHGGGTVNAAPVSTAQPPPQPISDISPQMDPQMQGFHTPEQMQSQTQGFLTPEQQKTQLQGFKTPEQMESKSDADMLKKAAKTFQETSGKVQQQQKQQAAQQQAVIAPPAPIAPITSIQALPTSPSIAGESVIPRTTFGGSKLYHSIFGDTAEDMMPAISLAPNNALKNIPQPIAAPAVAMSDERNKTDVRPARRDIKEFLTQIRLING